MTTTFVSSRIGNTKPILMCQGQCGHPTLHLYDRLEGVVPDGQRVGAREIFRCVGCDHERVWGYYA